MATAAFLALVIIALIAILAPAISPYDPLQADFSASSQGPNRLHAFGTDWQGRDQLSRLFHGTRISLMVGVFAVLAGTTAGALWGLLSGYTGGVVDLASQRFLEMLMSFPSLLLAIALAAVLGPGLVTVMIALAAIQVGPTARVTRSVALSTMQAEYVLAARTVGASWPRIAAFHVAPSVIPPFLVMFTAQVGLGIIGEATLGFLGVGVPPPAPSWGSMLAIASQISNVPPWWLAVFPGLAISVVVLAWNLLGDGVRDELDPRLRGSR